MRRTWMLAGLCTIAAVGLPASAVAAPPTLTLSSSGLGTLPANTAIAWEGYLEIRGTSAGEPFCGSDMSITLLSNGASADQASISQWAPFADCEGAQQLLGAPFDLEMTGKRRATVRAGSGKVTGVIGSCRYEASKLPGVLAEYPNPGETDLLLEGKAKLNKHTSGAGCTATAELFLEGTMYVGAHELVRSTVAKVK